MNSLKYPGRKTRHHFHLIQALPEIVTLMANIYHQSSMSIRSVMQGKYLVFWIFRISKRKFPQISAFYKCIIGGGGV